MRIPTGMSVADAAAIPEVFITAWDALVVQGVLTSGRWALVHAGGSGVGTAAIQICKAIGARIVVTCSAGKVAACRALGADVVVDYGSQDFVAEVAAATAGVGVDVVLDVIGGDYLERNIAVTGNEGSHYSGWSHGGQARAVQCWCCCLGKRASIIGHSVCERDP